MVILHYNSLLILILIIIKLLRINSNDEYKPELLREPYILSSIRADMTKKMSKELLEHFDDILMSLNEKDYVTSFKTDLKRYINITVDISINIIITIKSI